MTLAEFKSMHNILALNFRQSTGKRAFADATSKTGAPIRVFASEECAFDKPLYVTVGKYDAYWIGNTVPAEVVATV